MSLHKINTITASVYAIVLGFPTVMKEEWCICCIYFSSVCRKWHWDSYDDIWMQILNFALFCCNSPDHFVGLRFKTIFQCFLWIVKLFWHIVINEVDIYYAFLWNFQFFHRKNLAMKIFARICFWSISIREFSKMQWKMKYFYFA